MLLKYKEVAPTFTCEQWTGDNFDHFNDYFQNVTAYMGILEISEWIQEDKTFHERRAQVGQWVVYNHLTERIQIVDDEKFQKRFAILD